MQIFANVCFRDVDNVHDIMDDIAEQHDIANEISNAISNPVGFTDDLDEDELEKELEELEQEGLEEDLLKVPGPTELPAVPTGAIAKPVKPTASKYTGLLVIGLLTKFTPTKK